MTLDASQGAAIMLPFKLMEDAKPLALICDPSLRVPTRIADLLQNERVG